MSEYVYYVFNFVVFVPILLLSLFTDVQPHRAWRSFLLAFVTVSVPFLLWDAWAASEGHWNFSSAYITDYRLGGLPLEEIFFFVTVPFAMMYVWGVVQKHIAERVIVSRWPYIVLGLVVALSAVLHATNWSGGYTRSAALMMLSTIFILCLSRLIFLKTFWVFQLLLLTAFLIGNTILTALPIIGYGDAAVTGIRFGTIPIEDFLYNFAFINLFLLVFEWSVRRFGL